jgi:serine/threonine protein kinase
MILIKRIGQGGFGNVDLVQDEKGNQFAKKTFSVNQPGHFPPELVENVKKRFIREASVQKALTHNNIMPIYSSSLDNEPPFFIMPVAESSLSDDIELDKSLHGSAILIMKLNSFRDSNFKTLEHKFEHLSPIVKANISS